MNNKRLLFVCSRNKWRSPTAERIFKGQFDTRSAGTSPHAKHTVSPNDIRWADIVLVMEEKHKQRLIAQFTRMLTYKPIHVLNIPDDFQYMDAVLVDLLHLKITDDLI